LNLSLIYTLICLYNDITTMVLSNQPQISLYFFLEIPKHDVYLWKKEYRNHLRRRD
jgi:hypothetical protein